MTSVEEHHLNSRCGGVDPSNLHLKKELTQIRKAARGVLKDPGTSSSWRYISKKQQIHGGVIASSSEPFPQVLLPIHGKDRYSNGEGAILDRKNPKSEEKEKTVFLHNWREKIFENGNSTEKKIKDDEGYSSTREEVSPDSMDSLSSISSGGARHHSKSDGCLSNSILKCKNANLTPSIRRSIVKKPKKSSGSSANSRHHKEKLKMLLSRYTKNDSAGSSFGRDDLLSLVEHDTDTCINSEDLERAPAFSSLQARLRNKKVDDSITPGLSTGLYTRYSARNPSTIGSWDVATTASFNADTDSDNEVDGGFDLTGQPGCSIPCYWSRRSTPRSRTGSCCSPSISDTLRNSMLCGSRASYQKGPRRSKAVVAGQSIVPLLKRGGKGPASSVGSGILSDYEPSENYGELDLEGLSRLDRKRWSLSCGSRECLEVVGLNGEVNHDGSPENTTSLSYKHRLMFLDELIGQSIVVNALTGAVLKGKVSPLYIFHGPRGVGKTSAARIFTAALNCLAFEKTNKPCGVCRECADFVSGKSRYLVEIDGSNQRGIEKVKKNIEKISAVHLSGAISQYMVFVVEQCHLLPKKAWLAFLGLLKKPLFPRVVFILITTDVGCVPPAVLSRCQKLLFYKICNGDIVARLMKISSAENLDVEWSALELIASNVDGSLRDAETMLDQLSLFGKRITKSLVNELIGVVSDDKLLDLLELAMSSNATETVLRARELMDSGVDPIVLVSQLVTIIVDLIAGTYPNVSAKDKKNSFVGGMSLSEGEVDRLRHALTVLSEAENRLRVSCERSTWFTATLLQLGSLPSSPSRKSQSTCSQPHSSRTTGGDHNTSMPRVANTHIRSTRKEKTVDAVSFLDVGRNQFFDDEGKRSICAKAEVVLSDIWLKCIDKCHSKTLRQLLHSYGKLVSLSEAKGTIQSMADRTGGFVAFVAFEDSNIKTRAEGFLSSLTNSFEIVLRSVVEVKLILLQEEFTGQKPSTPMNLEKTTTPSNTLVAGPDLDSTEGSPKLSKTSLNTYEDRQTRPVESISKNKAGTSDPKDNKSDVIIPSGRIESIIDEQRLETVWLQDMDKSTPESTSLSRIERKQVLPQNGVDNPNELESLHYCEDELSREIKALKINGEMTKQKVRRIESCPISPSVLHANKDNMGYESGSGGGCGGMFCWNDSRPQRREKSYEMKSSLAKALLDVHIKTDNFLGLESVRNRGGTDTVYEWKEKSVWLLSTSTFIVSY